MAVPPCLRLADDVFPRVRGSVARRLVAEGWSQSRAGRALGLSQAMVSKHVAAKTAVDPLAERLADELYQEILEPRPPAGVAASSWCATLTSGERPGGDEALRDLLAAERDLRAAGPLRVVPQVGLNLARALPGSDSPQEVLAFPGRLVEAGGRLLSPAPPAFGGSGHLARCLLAARERWPEVLALANVRGGKDVLATATGLGWVVAPVLRPARSEDPEGPFLRALEKARERPNAFHDPGAIGIEPCLYILAGTAQDAARSILRLHAAIVQPGSGRVQASPGAGRRTAAGGRA